MTTRLNLNEAEPQRPFDLIPAGTIVTAQMMIRAGGIGEDGWLKRSADGNCEGLDLEFTIVDGDYAKRKIWQFMILNGTTDGHAKAADISRTMLRGILESAHGIRPDDVSEEAQSKRNSDLADFQNLRFIARVSIEKSKDPAYDDKNKLYALTPDARQWQPVEQIPAPAQGTFTGMTGAPAAQARAAAPAKSAPAQAVARPQWANPGEGASRG
jgi:hypothetical protein